MFVAHPQLLQTCVWTGACPLAGCQNKCVADLGVGLARRTVTDRAFDASWFQLCPRLAQIVDIVLALTPNLTQSLPSPSNPPAQTNAQLAQTTATPMVQQAPRSLQSRATVRTSDYLQG
jgi:hypothetical protein